MSANIAADGAVKQLDQRSQADEQLAESDVRETSRLLRWLLTLFRRLSVVERRWAPRRVDFEGVVSTGTDSAPQTITLAHSFGSSIRWWVVDIQDPGVIVLPLITRANLEDTELLTLIVYYPATLTIRVEEAG